MMELLNAAEQMVRLYEMTGDHDHDSYPPKYRSGGPENYGDCPACHLRAVIHKEKSKMKPKWERLIIVRDGHTLFRDQVSGRYAFADRSGNKPENTDDGILWLDTDKVFERGKFVLTSHMKGYGYSGDVPVIAERNGESYKCCVHLKILKYLAKALPFVDGKPLPILIIDPQAGDFEIVLGGD